MTSYSISNPPIPGKAGDPYVFGNLLGSSLAFSISQVAKKNPGFTLVITSDNLAASRLEKAIKFFLPELDLLNFPDWETLPYDYFSPHRDLIAQRLSTLSRLLNMRRGILLVPITTLMQRIAPRNYIEVENTYFNCGDKIDLETIRKRLENSGYYCVSQVIQPGEFAIRGSILDLFPTSSEYPIRIDLLDDKIDSIRTFDIDTQCSIEIISRINLLPAHEFPLTKDAITVFQQRWKTFFPRYDIQHCSLYREVSQGHSPAGIEYYLPLFFSETQLLLDYLSENSLILQVGDIYQQAKRFWHEIEDRYQQRCHDIERPILAPTIIYATIEILFAKLKLFHRITLQHEMVDSNRFGRFNFSIKSVPDVTIHHYLEPPLRNLKTVLTDTLASKVLFCVETAGRREILLDLLKTIEIYPHFCASWIDFMNTTNTYNIAVAPLDEGTLFTDLDYLLITESQLFGQHVIQSRQRHKRKSEEIASAINHLAELSVGVAVVHIDHGIGRYLGLQTLTVSDHEVEFLVLVYADNDKLYVPISSLHLIRRYTGADSEHTPLHRLGSTQWEKAKRQAQEKIRDVAAELLAVYSKRATYSGYEFSLTKNEYQAFASTFPFEETPDQKRAIEQVICDMTANKPMDRLICGDVGFGKTEVAMRAAFIAVQNGKQVAVLVPTTLLSQQHYQNFKDRFADWPIRIEALSRFQSIVEQKNIITQLSEGKIDIVIGTHKLIQKKIHFKDLGLLIIDEEHRFGVKQKEKLKALRAEIDILTLTATPIPRTLNMAIAGLRELSIIATPPAQRLSIKTFIRERNFPVIREAILRELLRGGQVYFLHNAIETIQKTADEIQKLIPEAHIRIAHGQLRERNLEQVMIDFYHQRFNVLVCTTIIETGIDVPTANTIIIDRADRLGLAQLHQLRGRVGRSHHQAYAYLMTPSVKTLSKDAVQRLEAISSLGDLGIGFTLATQDLEIRGAGELLGEGQSGHIQSVGFSLYMEWLEQATRALKSEKTSEVKEKEISTEIDLQISALIPETYVSDVHIRLMFYKRLSHADNLEALNELQVELIDRFGLLPVAAKNLFQVHILRIKAQALGIKKIDGHAQGGSIEFIETPNINVDRLLRMLQEQPKQYKLENATRLRFFLAQESANLRINYLEKILNDLSKK